MKFFDERVLILPGEGIQLQWQWDPQSHDAFDVELHIERSGGSQGPWDELAVVDPRMVFSFHDNDAVIRNVGVDTLYYRLNAVSRTTDESLGVSRSVPTYGGSLLKPELWILEQQRRLLEGVNGHPAIKGRPLTIYKRVTTGNKCSICADNITGRVMVSNCKACVGTGRDRGFYDPVTVGANIQPYRQSKQLTNLQITDDVTTMVVMNNYPVVDPGDILVELDERHWRVAQKDVRERNRILVRQALFVVSLKPDDIAAELLRHRDNGGRKETAA